jgi:hypothetical protein
MSLRRLGILALCACGALAFAWRVGIATPALAQHSADWAQWASTAQHTGMSPAIGQSPTEKLAEATYDPFVTQEQAEEHGELLAHYQAPLVDGHMIFIESKSGHYVSCQPPGSGVPFPCGPDAWETQVWNEKALALNGGQLRLRWNFPSDWKPEPNGGNAGLAGWEPVFHAALSNGFVFVPGASGSVYKLNESDGTMVAQYAPFGTMSNTFVSGPLTADAKGNIYYNAITLELTVNPWTNDVLGAWLVQITSAGVTNMVSYQTLVPNASTMCGSLPCGSQRPGINIGPAVSADGQTIYTVSRGHLFPLYSFLVAANANLTPKWQTQMQKLGTKNNWGYITDDASSTPVVAPDGSVLFGALGGDGGRGFLNKFGSSGAYVTSYNFGWDSTPAVYAHGSTYSIITKDNHYITNGPYFITQLSADLIPEWQYQNTTIDKDHPDGYEWCVNAPAVDKNGTVYANSEDGNVYVLNQDGTLKGNLFLQLAIGAAYTPVAIGLDGKIYAENDGDMFVIGN